jgi:hypothetical protein
MFPFGFGFGGRPQQFVLDRNGNLVPVELALRGIRAAETPRVHCKAKGCTELHKHHYCKVCDNKDASHRSSNCPRLVLMATTISSCKVCGGKDHVHHHCKLCGNRGAGHRARACPLRAFLK